jgi:hypothetical protein
MLAHSPSHHHGDARRVVDGWTHSSFSMFRPIVAQLSPSLTGTFNEAPDASPGLDPSTPPLQQHVYTVPYDGNEKNCLIQNRPTRMHRI